MKICPFISHMIGDDTANTLTIDQGNRSESSTDSSENVVVLGYDEGRTATKTKSKRKTRSKAKADTQAHLFCLEDSCRFYQKKTGDCQFDLIFDMLSEQRKDSAKKPADTTKALQKDLDKIWKFQTQSVAELVESFSDSERKQGDAVTGIREELEKRMDDLEDNLADKLEDAPTALEKRFEELEETLTSKIGELGDAPDTEAFDKRFDQLAKDINKLGDNTDIEAFQRRIDNLAKQIGEMDKNGDQLAFQRKIEELSKRIADREESAEGLSETISEMVINVQEGLDRLRDKSDGMAEQVGKLQDDMPTADQVKGWVEGSVSSQIDGLDLNEAFRGIEEKLESAVNQQDDSAVDAMREKLDETLRVHRDIEQKLTDWNERIQETVGELRNQQNGWEQRLEDLGDRQTEMTNFLEEGRKRRETEESRQGKKEAKKYNNLGVTSFHNGAYEMAKDQFLKAVRLDPEFAEAYNNLGLSYTELNEEDKATEAFERAVQINPALHAAYNNLGYIFFKQGNYDQAVEMYNEALGRSTNNSSAYTNLGNAYYKMDKINEARDAWQQALELDPGNEKAKRNLQRIDES